MRFQKGNKAAKGGARPNSGPKPDVVKAAAKDLAQERVPKALAVIDKCLAFEEPPKPPEIPASASKDERSAIAEQYLLEVTVWLKRQPTWKDRVGASELMLAYAWHKPTQPMQHAGELAWVKVYTKTMPTALLLPPAK